MFQELLSVAFSELIEHNCKVISKFSPKGDRFASAFQSQLSIWKIETQDIVYEFFCDHPIESMEWSPDSELIYCCMSKGSIIQVWNLLIPNSRWKLVESPLAIIDILWTPDSRHLVVVSEFHIKVKIWSLVSISTTEIENVKPVKNCFSFSSCEQYLAVSERTRFKDQVVVFTCETWEILKFFPVETKNLSGIYFSPCDLIIAVLESPFEEFKVLFYSVDGRLLSKHDKTSLFGITSLSWYQNGKLLALGSYNGEVSILQGSNCREIALFHCPKTVDSEDIVVYKLVPGSSEQYQLSSKGISKFKIEKERPVIISPFVTSSKKNKSKNINCGVQMLQCSTDGQYIASVCGNQPHVLCIYDVKKLKLSSIVIYQHKIKNVSWHPGKSILNICTGSSSLDMWMPTCCLRIVSPFKDEFPINVAKWSSSQDSLVLNGEEKSSILRLPESIPSDMSESLQRTLMLY